MVPGGQIPVWFTRLFKLSSYYEDTKLTGGMFRWSVGKRQKEHLRSSLAALAPDMDHGAGGLEESGLANVVASLLALDDAVDVTAQFVVGFAGTHVTVQVVVDLGEEAGANFSV